MRLRRLGRARLTLAALLVALLAAVPVRASSSVEDTARVRRWREDLRFTVDRVLALHPRPFAHATRASFDSAAAAIERDLGRFDDRRVAIEMMRMLALLGDGHTMLIGTLPSAGFGSVLPVVLRPFEEGLYVTAADSAHRALVGARVTRIGGVTAAEAVERVAGITSGDNRFTRLDRVPLFLMLPGALHALGLTDDPGRARLTLERPGRAPTEAVVLGGPPPDGFPEAFQETETVLPAGWVSARTTAGVTPRCDRRLDEAWWAEYLPLERTLYLRLARVTPGSAERTFGRFVRETFALADSLRPAGLVLDLRHDHGGNNTILDALVRAIVERPWLDRPGGVLVLTDRGTFSAAMNACVFLESQTDAAFVGEPTGGRPNHFGDADQLATPHFGLLLIISRWAWQARLPWDDRPWIAPQVAVPWRYADWRERRDPALRAALDVVAGGTLGQRAIAAARSSGVPAILAACRAWAEAHPDPWRGIEPDLAWATRRSLEEHAVVAVDLAQACVDLFPRSAGAWTRLGQAQARLGRRAEAEASLRRALSIDPAWESARALLRSLGAEP